MHSENAPYKLGTETLNIFFFFLNKWMFEKDISEKKEKKNKGEMCCNKEAVNGACFWIFYSVHLCGRGKKLYSSVWRLRCAISMELLTLVCVCNIFTSTADLVLPRCFLMADWTCLCTDVAEEDKTLMTDMTIWYCFITFLSFTLTFTRHFGRTKCSV